MKKQPNFKAMFEEIEKERGIKEEDLINALKDALMSAAKKRFENPENLEVQMGPDGSAKIFDKVKGVEVTPSDFGRIAAQTAKQVILQKIREAEKEVILSEYEKKIGNVVNGMILRFDGNDIICDIGRGQGVMPMTEQIRSENYRLNNRFSLYILDIRETIKGKQIITGSSGYNFENTSELNINTLTNQNQRNLFFTFFGQTAFNILSNRSIINNNNININQIDINGKVNTLYISVILLIFAFAILFFIIRLLSISVVLLPISKFQLAFLIKKYNKISNIS